MVLNMCKKDDEQFNALRKNRRRLISKKQFKKMIIGR